MFRKNSAVYQYTYTIIYMYVYYNIYYNIRLSLKNKKNHYTRYGVEIVKTFVSKTHKTYL